MRKLMWSRLTAALLTAVMIFTTMPVMALSTTPVKAAEQKPETKEGEFFAFLYSHRTSGTKYLYSPWSTTYEKLQSDGPKATAALAAQYLSTMPEGKRCIDLTGISKGINDESENWLWWDKSVDKLSEYMDVFFKELKAKGIELDYLIDDMESGMSNWTFNHNAWKLPEVIGDPRYETEIRPLLVENGFEFFEPTDDKTELHYLVSFTKSRAYLIWNTIMENRESDYYRRAFTEPALKYYPDLKSSNYGSSYRTGEYKVYDTQGHKGYLGGATYGAGTYSAPVLYGRIGQLCQKGRAPEDYPYDTFPNNSYNAMIYAMVHGSTAMLGTPGANFMPWVGLKHWEDSKYNNSYYYDETMFHLAMMNADPFLLYNVGGNFEADDEQYLSDLLNEINTVVGTGKRKTLVNDAIKWDQRYVLTGLELEDKNIWRITPDLYTPGITMENFLSDSKNMIFQIGNQVVDFPEGTEILDYDSMSDYGYWITTPKGTRPEEIRAEGIEIPAEQVEDAENNPIGYTVDKTYEKYVPGKTQAITDKEENQTEENTEPEKEESAVKPSVDTSSIAGHWAARALSKAVADGLIVGSDKGLEPDRNVTKAELITMIMRAIGMENNQSAGPQWYSYAANKAVELGWTNYLGDIELDINRAASAEVIANALKLDKNANDKTFTDDAEISSTGYLGAVKGCAALGIITGYPDGSFKPLNTITRAEAVVIIQRAYY